MDRPMPDAGRPIGPVLLTPERSEYICEAIRTGAPLLASLEAAGISTATYYRWLDNGEKEGPEYVDYQQFREDVKKAKGRFVVEAVKGLQAAGSDPKYWTALAWLLERRCPEEFGKKETEILAQQQRQIDEIKAKIAAGSLAK